ncbi:MAG TPA: hypothetical protein VJM33_19435 [Microthrixaceae bacterium]|nr:hypothetical protein [Microthrixaceae bacterium]
MIAYVIGADEADRLGSMAVYFLLAVVIVAPYAVVRVRRVLRDRRGRQAAGDGTDPGGAPSTAAASSAADASSEPADPLAAAVATIDAASDAGDEMVEVRVPIEGLIGRRSVPADVADLLLGDALRRSGFVIEEERIENAERVLRCRRIGRGT